MAVNEYGEGQKIKDATQPPDVASPASTAQSKGYPERQTPAAAIERLEQIDRETEAGNMPPTAAGGGPAGDPHARTREITKRLQREGRWFGQAEETRNELMRSAKGKFETKEQAQAWVYSELDRMYPKPPEILPNVTEKPIRIGNSDQGIRTYDEDSDTYRRQGKNLDSVQTGDGGQIQGLNDLPGDWPELPANASMGVELAWVQANRLRVVTEKPGKATRVDLGKAISPAPSWAALGWLETSIRSYAKFLDAAVKVGGGEDEGESAVMKRERKSVEEVRALLREMEAAAGTCPTCGQAFPDRG